MPTFDEVLSALQDCDPREDADKAEIRRLIVNLRDQVEDGPHSEFSVSLDAALHLTRLFESVDDESLGELHVITSGLVAFAKRTLSRCAGGEVLQVSQAPQVNLEMAASFADAPAAPPIPIGGGVKKPSANAVANNGEKNILERTYGQLDESADFMLGEILVELGMVAKEAVELARQAQTANGERLGEVLVDSGLIKHADLQMALSLQGHVSRVSLDRVRSEGYVDHWSLGQLLVNKGVIDEETLERGLKHHRENGVKLGEALVALAAVTWDDVTEAIRSQRAGGTVASGAQKKARLPVEASPDFESEP